MFDQFRQTQGRLKVVVQKRREKPMVLHQVAPRSFTVGSDLNCSYSISSTQFDRRHHLIRRRHGRNHLWVPAGIVCELFNAEGKSALSSEVLLSLGLVERVGNFTVIPFHAGAKAIIKLGDVALGLEYTSAPREGPRDKLQRDLRYSVWQAQDRVFAAILLFNLVLNVFSIWWLKGLEFPPHTLEDMDKRYAKLILETPIQSRDLFPPVREEKIIPEEPKEAEKLADKTPKKSAPEVKKSKSEGERGQGGLLGSLDKMGGVDGVLQNRQLKDTLQGVGVLTTKRPAGQQMPGLAFASRGSVNVDDMVAGIAARQGQGSGGGMGKGTTAVSNPFDVSGSGKAHHLRSHAEIDRIIRQHLEGVRILYERYLRKNSLLRGRVSLKFTIDPQGKITQCSVVSSTLDAPDFVRELVSRVSLWQFPVIEGSAGSVSVEYPFTFLPKGSS